MIIFKNWKITANGRLLAMQYDNLSRELKVVGEIPEGYNWSAMVQVGELFDIILLEPQADGSLSSSLSAQQLSVSGEYIVQLKGVKDNIVRHTNQLTVFVGDSLSGDANWPEIPSEFTQIEQRVYKAMNNAVASEEATLAARDSARMFANNAESMANDAAGQAKVAESFKEMAEDAALRADRSRSDADTAAKNAASSETVASNSAAEAKASAAAAAVSETNALDASEEAKKSEQNANISANEAEQFASDVAKAVNTAEMYASAAGGFATSAEQKKEAAETAAKTAESNATAAAASAKAAAESAKEAASHSPEGYAPKNSPVFTGSVSLGRSVGTTVGANSTALGSEAEASGDYSHAEGSYTIASNDFAHAEGQETTASGRASHAEGNTTVASEMYSHAEGLITTASGIVSHAEGFQTIASGAYTHSEGQGTIAASSGQHVQGKYNVEDAVYKYAHIVGNGSSDTDRSNAHTLDWNGNAWFAGNVFLGGTGQNDPNAVKLGAYEEWTFTLEDGSTVTKKVLVIG